MAPHKARNEGAWRKDHHTGIGRRYPRPAPLPEGLLGLVARARRFFSRGVWLADTSTMPLYKRLGYKILRVMSLTLRGFTRDRCLFRAQALTFITVMSIVPLLAFTFSVAKGLGAYDRLETQIIVPFLDENMGPAPVDGASDVGLRSTIDSMLDVVNQTDFAGLGLFGLAILLYTVVKLLSSIEGSFNEIWGVERSRSLPRKVSDYLSVLVVVPILLIAATGATAAIKSGEAFGSVQETLHLGPMVKEGMRFSSLFAAWFGFAFIYIFMPNTRVRLFSALMGGLLGSLLWSFAQVLYVKGQVGVANQSAIYASVAAIPIFLVWVNVSWITVLMGAELAFAHQNEPAFLQIAKSREEDQSFRERVALRALARLAGFFRAGEELPEVPILAADMGVPERSLEEALITLKDEGLMARVEGKGRRYTFTKSPDQIRVKDVLDALKGARATSHLEVRSELDEELETLLDDYEAERAASPLNRRLGELGSELGAESAPED
jgi:membrane protein